MSASMTSVWRFNGCLLQVEMSQGDYSTIMGIMTDNLQEGVDPASMLPPLEATAAPAKTGEADDLPVTTSSVLSTEIPFLIFLCFEIKTTVAVCFLLFILPFFSLTSQPKVPPLQQYSRVPLKEVEMRVRAVRLQAMPLQFLQQRSVARTTVCARFSKLQIFFLFLTRLSITCIRT